MKIKLVSVLEITITSKSIKGRVLLCLVIQGGLGTTAEVTQHNWLKMVAGAYAASPRRQKTYKNGYSTKANGFAAHEQAKLKEFKESFTEDFEDTPFQVAVLTYLSYFFLILFGYLRDFMRKYGLEKSKAPKEGGNEVRMWSKSAFTYKEIFISFLKSLRISRSDTVLWCQLLLYNHESLHHNLRASTEIIFSQKLPFIKLRFCNYTSHKENSSREELFFLGMWI